MSALIDPARAPCCPNCDDGTGACRYPIVNAAGGWWLYCPVCGRSADPDHEQDEERHYSLLTVGIIWALVAALIAWARLW